MKKILLCVTILVPAALATGILSQEAKSNRVESRELSQRGREALQEVERLEFEIDETRQSMTSTRGQRDSAANEQMSPQLADWLRGGNYTRIPENLTPQLFAALELPWNDSTNFVLINKATLHRIAVSWNGRGTNMLGHWVCGLLGISPDEQRQVDAAAEQARTEFFAWAKANLQREGPSGKLIARYTIPASPELAQRLTNQLFSTFTSVLGAERGQLLWRYEDHWFDMRLGRFGAVANTLILSRRSDNGPSNIWYSDQPRGHGGPILKEEMPGIFERIFPGGWAEIAQREGFEFTERSSKTLDQP